MSVICVVKELSFVFDSPELQELSLLQNTRVSCAQRLIYRVSFFGTPVKLHKPWRKAGYQKALLHGYSFFLWTALKLQGVIFSSIFSKSWQFLTVRFISLTCKLSSLLHPRNLVYIKFCLVFNMFLLSNMERNILILRHSIVTVFINFFRW